MRKIHLISNYSSLLCEVEDGMVVKKNRQGEITETLGTPMEILEEFENNVAPYGIIRAEIIERVDKKWVLVEKLVSPKMRSDMKYKLKELRSEIAELGDRGEVLISEMEELVIRLSR